MLNTYNYVCVSASSQLPICCIIAKIRQFLQHYPSMCFCGRVPWLYQYWPVGFMLFVVLCPGTPEGSTGSDSGFKASQKTGQRLKVSSDRLREAGNRTSDPWFTRPPMLDDHISQFCFFCMLICINKLFISPQWCTDNITSLTSLFL